MKQEQSHAYAAACYHGEYASCSYACPFRVDVRSFMANIRKGSFQAAYRILSDTVLFPGIVTELCQEFCKAHCVRRKNGQALSILEVEKACVRLVRSKTPLSYNIPQKNKTIAVIGAGLSGMACALRLAVKKYHVHVYEKEDNLGGVLRTHEKFELFLTEIMQRIQNEAIEFHFNHSVDDIGSLNCDAVYIATGKNGNDFGLLDSFDDKTLGTNESRCFMGGMLTGVSILDSLEHGMRASKQIEKFLLTGEVHDYIEEYPYENCERLMQIDTLPDQPAVIPANPEGYTKEEAVREASRCLKCDCSRCMKSCEMLQSFKKSPLKIVKEIYTDSIVLHGLSHRTLTREVASCNMCGQCKSVCPTAVDMGAAFLFARRDRVEQNN